MKGVKEVKADFGKQRLDIVFDPAVLAEERIIQAARELGFTLKPRDSTNESPERK